MTAVKNPTQWRPESGHGFVVPTGSLSIVNKAGLLVVNKAGLVVVQNPTQVIPKYPTIWTASGV
jgi:hypothetical protein